MITKHQLVDLGSQHLINDHYVRYFNVGIVGCCNGLVCLSFKRGRENNDIISYFRVWNPATRTSRDIIIANANPRGLHLSSHLYSCGAGFGYVSSTDDYYIVSVFNGGPLYILSLRDGVWRLVSSSYITLIRNLLNPSADHDQEHFTKPLISGTSVWVGDSLCWKTSQQTWDYGNNVSYC